MADFFLCVFYFNHFPDRLYNSSSFYLLKINVCNFTVTDVLQLELINLFLKVMPLISPVGLHRQSILVINYYSVGLPDREYLITRGMALLDCYKPVRSDDDYVVRDDVTDMNIVIFNDSPYFLDISVKSSPASTFSRSSFDKTEQVYILIALSFLESRRP